MADANVVATAGHVDHGKSTLVRALTGMEPDRWDEERRRGLTIDLGFAWTTLASGRTVAFVDVPGHERFIGNMLAGIGPAPVVCFVVAADEGWQQQSSDHRDAIEALGIDHGLIVLSRIDRAQDPTRDVLAQVRDELANTGLRDAPAVEVSAVDGTGINRLRNVLDDVLGNVPAPAAADRVRLWIDRAFTIAGAGTVVTGTLGAGAISADDELELVGDGRRRRVTVRGLQSGGSPLSTVGPVSRVAVNLRGVGIGDVHRGDVLVSIDRWPTTRSLDVRRASGRVLGEVPAQLTAHVGTLTVPVRVRPFDDDHARLGLTRSLPLVVGDRLVLRDPGGRRVLAGVQILDADPPALRRRGDGNRRAHTLAGVDATGDIATEIARHGAVSEQRLRLLGIVSDGEAVPDGVRAVGGWWVDVETYESWQRRLRASLEDLYAGDPLTAGLSQGAVRDLLSLPDERLVEQVVTDAGLEQRRGYVRLPGSDDLGPIEASVTELERRLGESPFRAPEAGDLAALSLGVRELAAAERAGRLLRLREDVVLLPSAPALAMRELSALAQPFTTSAARQALDTTRRVAVPLLEHLDSRGWTRRIDAGHREVTSPGARRSPRR